MTRKHQSTKLSANAFYAKAEQMQKQWYPLMKASMETVNIIKNVPDERSAQHLISTWKEYLTDELRVEQFELLLDFNFDVVAWDFLTEPGQEKDTKWWVLCINKTGEYLKTRTNLSVVLDTLNNRDREGWTYQETCKQIAQRYEEIVRDAAAVEYNRFCRAGSKEWAHAKFVGMKAAEIGRKGRIVNGLAHRAKEARKGQGDTRRDNLNASELKQAKYDALLEDIPNITLRTERIITFDGKEKIVPQMCPDNEGNRLWRESHKRVAKQLGSEGDNAKECPIKLNSELSIEMADVSEGDGLINSLPGGIDPAEEFNSKEEVQSRQEKLERFRRTLSPQQREYFDLVWNDTDLAPKDAAQMMGLPVQQIYKIRDRIKEKRDKWNEDAENYF